MCVCGVCVCLLAVCVCSLCLCSLCLSSLSLSLTHTLSLSLSLSSSLSYLVSSLLLSPLVSLAYRHVAASTDASLVASSLERLEKKVEDVHNAVGQTRRLQIISIWPSK